MPVSPSAALVLIAVISLIPNSTLAAESSSSLPDFTLTIPASFNTSVTVKHYRKGEDILNSPPFHLITTAAMTEYHGWYGPRTADLSRIHPWNVRVYAARNLKVVGGYAKARDGFKADLNEGKEFFSLGPLGDFRNVRTIYAESFSLGRRGFISSLRVPGWTRRRRYLCS